MRSPPNRDWDAVDRDDSDRGRSRPGEPDRPPGYPNAQGDRMRFGPGGPAYGRDHERRDDRDREPNEWGYAGYGARPRPQDPSGPPQGWTGPRDDLPSHREGHGEGWLHRTTRSSGGFRGRGPRDYNRSDERIREEVCERLMDDDHVDATDITVTVKDAEVSLGGTVSSRIVKRLAEDLAAAVTGVKDVHNGLKIGSPSRADAGQLETHYDRHDNRRN